MTLRRTAYFCALLLAAPARANDCAEGATHTVCTNDGFRALIDETGQIEDERDLCRVDLTRVTTELEAARARSATVEAANARLAVELSASLEPAPVWPWAVGGALVGLVLGVVLAR